MGKGPETHHVVPNKDKGGWDVRRGGADRKVGELRFSWSFYNRIVRQTPIHIRIIHH